MKTSGRVALFFSQVRQEALKVAWPARNETFVATFMILLIVTVSSFFFFAVDIGILKLIQFMLGLGS